MKFLMEWTKKRGVIALLGTASIVSAFILGGYIATGNWNPWGNRHYYQVLNANFEACYIPEGGPPECQSSHNVIFNTGARYVQQVVTSGAANPALCTVGATCSFNFIAMSSSTAAPAAGQNSIGVNGAAASGDCGNAGGTAGQNGSEWTTNGLAAAAGTVTDITGNSPQTSTVVHTFTVNTAASTVAQSCLVNQTTANSANRVNLAAATFTAITLQPGDTIQITWSITWTWS